MMKTVNVPFDPTLNGHLGTQHDVCSAQQCVGPSATADACQINNDIVMARVPCKGAHRIFFQGRAIGCERGHWLGGGHHGECRACAYNGGLGAEPPAGSRGRAPGQGGSSPEAESILVIGCPTEPANLAPASVFLLYVQR